MTKGKIAFKIIEMKNKIILLTILSLFLLIGGVGCEKEKEKSLISSNDIGEIVSVFELMYNSSAIFVYNNDKIKISFQDVIDNVTVNCSLMDFQDNNIDPSQIKIYSYLKINDEMIIEVASKPCGALQYKSEGDNVQEIIDLIDELKSAPANINNKSYFADAFIDLFGEGTLIKKTSYKIFIAKAFPIEYEHLNIIKEDYKLIFILTYQ